MPEAPPTHHLVRCRVCRREIAIPLPEHVITVRGLYEALERLIEKHEASCTGEAEPS